MRYSWLAPLLIHVVACALPAQEPLITPATPIDDNILHQWLHSGDPRLIAWAADFARKTRNAKIVAEMPELLEHWAIPQVLGDTDSRAAQVSAISAILDTLIQENAQVPIPAINAIAEVLPAQAAILIARLPLSESRATLEDWTYGETGTWTGRTRAHRIHDAGERSSAKPHAGLGPRSSPGWICRQRGRSLGRGTGNHGRFLQRQA